MKEALAITLGGMQGLGATDDQRERPVDRLGALAMAQSKRGDALAAESFMASLGGALIALKWSNRTDLRAEVDLSLAIAIRWPQWDFHRLSGKQADRIARWAVTEYIIPFCLTCRGAKESPNHQDIDGTQPMIQCPTCSGSGRRRFTDEERTEAMGAPFDKAMDVAHQILTHSEALAIRGTARMLERW
jgi:hypothetical protein